ncbi:MAG: cbb3-type cytochrome c oxidase N-terminal domain-containing protein [Planctomycetota bacterium]
MAHDPKVLEHEYDGIQEFDNPTPGWWHALFFLFIAFGAVYMLVTTGSPLYSSPQQTYEKEKLTWTRALFGSLGDLEADEATIVRYYADEREEFAGRWMPYAESLFRANCASCHGGQGQGGIGPNLTDNAFKNIAAITDIHSVIADGANNNAMPAWSNRFHPNEIVLLSSYVAWMRDRNISGKPPEGEEIAPWPTLDEVGGPLPGTPEDAGG